MLNDLMNNRHCSVRFLEPELQWSDTRIDHGPLTRPILTDTGVAKYGASLHPIRSFNIGAHRGQGALDVAGVKRFVLSSDPRSPCWSPKILDFAATLFVASEMALCRSNVTLKRGL